MARNVPIRARQTLPAASPGAVVISLVGGMQVYVPAQDRVRMRQKLQALSRIEKFKASSAGNKAETAKIIGGLGGTIAAAGTLALATATLPATLPVIAVTAFAYLIMTGGIILRQVAMESSYEHQVQQDDYADAVADLK
jgi:hypothetical protein